MQRWREWQAASASDWGAAHQREAVIRPLAEQTRLAAPLVAEALLAFGLDESRSTVAFVATGNDRKLRRC
jgi:hypothetical protein